MIAKTDAAKTAPTQPTTLEQKPQHQKVGRTLDPLQLKQVGGGNNQIPVRGW